MRLEVEGTAGMREIKFRQQGALNSSGILKPVPLARFKGRCDSTRVGGESIQGLDNDRAAEAVEVPRQWHHALHGADQAELKRCPVLEHVGDEALRLTRCDDVLRPFMGGRSGLIIIRI